MGRKHKIDKEIKVKAILDYLDGVKSTKQITHDLNITKSSFCFWVKQYKKYGEVSFDYKQHNSQYSKQFKEKVINDYLNGNGSSIEIALKYDIPSMSIVNKWISLYNSGKEIKDYNPLYGVYTMKAKKTTIEEKIEIVNYCINNNKNYKITADKYCLPYSLVCQWVKR